MEHQINELTFCSSVTVVSIILIAQYLKRKKQTNMKNKKRKRAVWCKEWLKRRGQGRDVLAMLNNELLVEDPVAYRNFLRMHNVQFEYLMTLIAKQIAKYDTVMREAIPPRSRLEVTLRYLATGESFRSLMYATRMHETTISRIVTEVCTSLIVKLKPLYLQTPRCKEKWKEIAREFDRMWQFPHCIGALDGRHITFRAPLSSGSYYYNYKGNNSIVLLGLADAHYRFIYVNIGVNGRISDGGVFNNSRLSQALHNNSLDLPDPEKLPGMNAALPYVIVADDAFPLSEHIMKPYPHRGLDQEDRIFNYRLSRSRRIIENSFGILANRFRVLLNPINLNADKVQLITEACVLLHNFLATENSKAYTEMDEQFEQLPQIGRQGGNRSSHDAREIREMFKYYFNSPEGSVNWQLNAVNNFNM